MDSVALVKHTGDVNASLEEGIGLIGGFGELLSPVIVKPNICTNSDNTGYSVTRVEVVESLIQLVLHEDERISIRIVESDSESKFAMDAFDQFGYNDLCDNMQSEGHDVSLVNLSSPPLVEVELNGQYFEKLEIHEILTKPCYFVTIAAAKTHYLTFITGALKNQFGLLPKKGQSSYHRDIDDVIVDLNRFVKPDLCIVDGRVGVEGWNGPRTRPLNLFLIGRNPVSVDATLTRIMGFKPQMARHLMECGKIGLGTLNPEVLGESIESMAVGFDSPSKPS
ncbi:MAG: DUF362 domain-containing protein [Candidatus Thorarchaeota archaeon]|nr:MAG: DUF362 domain-containing protein [Candidatus Thorarchaeota archaeon]